MKSEKVAWCCRPYIPKGKITSIDGDPGVGKSWLELAIAAAISQGGKIDGSVVEPGNVLILAAEDGLGDTIRPRLERLNANLDRIVCLDNVLILDPSGLRMLEEAVNKVKPVIVFIDPLMAYTGGKVDANRATQMRAIMTPLHGIAARHNTAVTVIRHLNKADQMKAIYRSAGSIDITAACRSVLFVGIDPNQPKHRVVAHAKSNLAPVGASLCFTITDDGGTGKFEWAGTSTVTAEQLCQAGNVDEDQSPSALEEAKDFIRQLLANGRVEATVVNTEAATMGIATRTLKRAKRALHVRSKKDGDDWYWLPISMEGGQEA